MSIIFPEARNDGKKTGQRRSEGKRMREGNMTWVDQARKKRELDHEPKYGPIQPKRDKRCFRKEMIEELLDALNYAQWSFQKGEITRSHFQRIDRATRIAIRLIEEACVDKFQWEMEWVNDF